MPYLTNGCIESLSKKSWSFSTLVMSIGNWQSKKINFDVSILLLTANEKTLKHF